MDLRIGRRAIAVSAAVAAVLVTVVQASPAAAATDAIVNGSAVAAGALVPVSVDPDFDFWPIYSLSEVASGGSHGLSGGLYPGWLLDAFASLYGRPEEARAALGISESQWPGEPTKAEAATSDFGDKCRFGREFGIPQYMLDSCKSMWDQFGRNAPMRASASRTASGPNGASGEAEGSIVMLGDGVTIGAVESNTMTDTSGARTRSTATTILKDVRIADLRIGQIRSTAVAFSGGTTQTSDATSTLELIDVTYQGNRAVITDRTVLVEAAGQKVAQDLGDAAHPRQLTDVGDELAEHGFDVRLLPGFERVGITDASAEAGGLIIRSTQEPPKELVATARQACATSSDAYPKPVTTVPLDFGDNPLYSDEFPFNQVPETVEMDIAVPPPAPCIAAQFDRAVEVGLVLAPARAAARYEKLPPIRFRPPAPPTFDVLPGYDSVGVNGGRPPVSRGPDGGFVATPPSDGSSSPPPPPATGAPLLGAAVARRVETVYGGIVLALAFMLGARSRFRRLIRM